MKTLPSTSCKAIFGGKKALKEHAADIYGGQFTFSQGMNILTLPDTIVKASNVGKSLNGLKIAINSKNADPNAPPPPLSDKYRGKATSIGGILAIQSAALGAKGIPVIRP